MDIEMNGEFFKNNRKIFAHKLDDNSLSIFFAGAEKRTLHMNLQIALLRNIPTSR